MKRVVAITGAGGALGAAVSRRLAADPGTAMVLSDVSESSLATTVNGLGDAVVAPETILADVRDPAAVQNVVNAAVDRFGRLDVLVSNAGILSTNGRIHNVTLEEWERAFRINVLGHVNGITAAVNVMRPQRSGSIVLTASVGRIHGLVAFGALLRHQGSGHCVGQGGSGRVCPGQHSREFRLSGYVPLGHPRRLAQERDRRHRR